MTASPVSPAAALAGKVPSRCVSDMSATMGQPSSAAPAGALAWSEVGSGLAAALNRYRESSRGCGRRNRTGRGGGSSGRGSGERTRAAAAAHVVVAVCVVAVAAAAMAAAAMAAAVMAAVEAVKQQTPASWRRMGRDAHQPCVNHDASLKPEFGMRPCASFAAPPPPLTACSGRQTHIHSTHPAWTTCFQQPRSPANPGYAVV